MKVALWAEIRRLAEIEKLSGRLLARRLHCSRHTVAAARRHQTIQARPIDRFEQERTLLRPLPAIPFDADEVVPAVVSPHARIAFDGKRYSVPPQFVRRPITVRANRDDLRLLHEGQVVAQHVRSYERGQLLVLPEHRLAALSLRQRPYQRALEQEFDAWGPEARAFQLGLNSRPVKWASLCAVCWAWPNSTGGPKCWPPWLAPWN